MTTILVKFMSSWHMTHISSSLPPAVGMSDTSYAVGFIFDGGTNMGDGWVTCGIAATFVGR